MKKQTRDLGRTERAVIELIRTAHLPGALPESAILALYRREVSALAHAGLVERTEAGLRIVGAAPAQTPTPAPITIPTPPPREILENLNVRVPHAVHEGLELIAGGPGRKSDVVRAIIAFALPVLVDAHARGVTVGPDNALDVLRSALKANGSGMHRATGT